MVTTPVVRLASAECTPDTPATARSTAISQLEHVIPRTGNAVSMEGCPAMSPRQTSSLWTFPLWQGQH